MATALHPPEGILVIHMRSDCDPRHRTLVGRVEHVRSGDTATFATLDALLTFLGRYVPSSTETTRS